MLKTEPHADYPPEPGRYLRGNDYSPVALAVILIHNQEEIPPDIEDLVRLGVETGAALSGTLQTESIGIEKIVCNIVANPNIRYLVICGPESPGHLCGEALLKLLENGVDERRKIIGSQARTPYLFNLPGEFIVRFHQQISAVNLLNEGDPDLVRRAIRACYQEAPTMFRQYSLSDPGALAEPPLSGRLTWRVTNPYTAPKDEIEQTQRQKLRDMMARMREVSERKRNADVS